MNPIAHNVLLAQSSTGDVSNTARLTLLLLYYLPQLALFIASGWRLFTKANRPGWAILVPFYNLFVLLKIANKPTWWFVVMLALLITSPLVLPILAFITFWVMTLHGLTKAFGKDVGYTLGLIFVPWIFFPLIAFGKATYVGAEPDAVNARPQELFT